MWTRARRAAILLLISGSLPAFGQFAADRYLPSGAELAELKLGRTRLARTVDVLRRSADAGALPDVEIYLDAVDRLLRQNLFFSSQNVLQARRCLEEGARRADQLLLGQRPWLEAGGFLVLGYRSKVDGSAQPYQLYVPRRHDRKAPSPLQVYLHGRASTLNEVAFLTTTTWTSAAFGTAEPPGLVLYPYGRGNNGWRWAGEQDAWEALADARRRIRVDPEQVSLRGFSMGGHGTWHLGLQHPGEWSAMAPGAGFTDTLVYQKITSPLPDWQRSLLRLYDPLDYAANARNVPVLAYCGDADPALGQHEQMIAALKRETAPYREFIGPNTPHRYEPSARQRILATLAPIRREPDAAHVDFTTYTLRWPECKWVRLEGLARHWERARIRADRERDSLNVVTGNVTAVQITLPSGPGPSLQVMIDGQALGPAEQGGRVSLVRSGDRWRRGAPKGLRKQPGLQGPIDDALFGPVLAVRPTGTAWHPGMARWLDQELDRFRTGWDRYLRATLPEVADSDGTRERLRGNNLYVFGDPGSNSVLRRLLPGLPLQWSRDAIRLGGRSCAPAEHLPVLIYPNPEDPGHYVVLNVGFTFSREDWEGSNARQYPHLPDYAILRYAPDRYHDDHRSATVIAGFFDERWRLPER